MHFVGESQFHRLVLKLTKSETEVYPKDTVKSRDIPCFFGLIKNIIKDSELKNVHIHNLVHVYSWTSWRKEKNYTSIPIAFSFDRSASLKLRILRIYKL